MPDLPDMTKHHASMTEPHANLIRKLAMSLDTCMDLVHKAAEAERRREEGKSLRNITWQNRVPAFRDLVDAADMALLDAGKFGVPR